MASYWSTCLMSTCVISSSLTTIQLSCITGLTNISIQYSNTLASQSISVVMKSSWKSLPDSLFSLCFPDLRFLIPLSKDIIECSSSDGSAELCCSACPLLHQLFTLTFLVLSSVQNGPADFTRIPLHQMRLFTLRVNKLENL